MPKLTLSVDRSAIARAKRYAKKHGTSVSAVVEAYLTSLGGPSQDEEPPILSSLRGILKGARVEDYTRHLAKKYR
jgi:hypothetical protein